MQRKPVHKTMPRKSLGVVAIGDCPVALAPKRAGSLAFIDDYRRMLAGAELNVCIGCARLQIAAGMISQVSADPFGEFVVRSLRAEGVDVAQVTVDESHRPAALLFKERLPDGDFRVYYHRHNAAACAMEFTDALARYVSAARAFLYTGIFPALSATNHRTLLRLLDVAKAAGTMRVFDPNIRMKLLRTPARAKRLLRPLAARADLVLLGESEAEMLYGAADADALFARLAKDGVAHAVLKRGAAGAVAMRGGERFEVAAHPAPAVVDTCGAGDAFNAGYLAGLLHRFPTARALKLAAYCAAQVVASDSDNESLPAWNSAQALGMQTKVAR